MFPIALSASLTQAISQATQEDFQFKTAQSVSGGDINQAYKMMGEVRIGEVATLNLSEPRTYFVKLNRADRIAMFEAEAEGLTQIAQFNTIVVPKPICYGQYGAYAYLVLEDLSLVALTDRTRYELGRKLAELHRMKGSTAFGWSRENTIGSTPQPNPWTHNWTEFWQVSRIGHQLSLARQKGAKFSQGDRLLKAIPQLLQDHSPQPSLVHGDLWGGNAAALATGEPVIFDPAVYWGDREVDLAMTELFGGFGQAFYQGYESIYPIAPGFAQRKTLYNLYHILNHYNLFGGSYASQADRMMANLLN